MRIAIFADIHGKILLPFKLVGLYQQTTGEKVDLILQCGDMGAYPDLNKLDKATLKHAKYNRDELGFAEGFVKVDAAIQQFLEKLDLEMICVRGNHEDHDYLDELEQTHQKENRFPIDIYKKVWVCKSGKIQRYSKHREELVFVGVGRIGDRKGRLEKRFIQTYEKQVIKKLLNTKEDFDLLLSHDKDDSSQRGYGMAELRTLLDNVLFYYHFYGHTGEDFKEEEDYNGITRSCKIKELEFNEAGLLPYGCMIILEKSGTDKLSIKVVDKQLTDRLRKDNWKEYWE